MTDTQEIAVTIRPGDVGDAPTLAAWHGEHGWCYDDAAVLAEYHDDQFAWSSVLVADDENGALAGKIELFIGYKTSYGKFGLISRFVIRPDLRGRGVGRQLLAAVTAWAEREGLRFLELTTEETNTAAWSLYASEGFVPAHTEVILRKPLGGQPLPEDATH